MIVIRSIESRSRTTVVPSSSKFLRQTPTRPKSVNETYYRIQSARRIALT
ncbi:hypothetical protein HETIRDRAFT_319572 [Heterobasidion irregulare TC 32-1]|uniref:Uncharacterized protein n=1 Tax=Heterobasidion irregulare (strain TC 32-1) TaxID=747525 RepID=W4K5S5_HETIT|nr:uncharacterized protein HETIRDRAFT_319572 [Heterobasidion irregulare TC 32-1]ETW80705.1 hypothetical protein HETIRDRAFT_319572 [Heterobasidion irregulare TC 32-1]